MMMRVVPLIWMSSAMNGAAEAVRWLGRALVLVAVVWTASASADPRADATLTPNACPVKAAAGVECFTLNVAENRAKPASRVIGVPLVRLRSRAAHPAEPMVLIVGGPGASSMRDGLDPQRSPYTADRDVILFQQRGTRLSSPELACPEWNPAKTVAEKRAAAAACGARLRGQGIDLDGYDTAAIVDDLLDATRLLHTGPVDLYGVSFGTTIALEVLRKAPAAVHAAILDSTLPPDIRYDEMSVEATLRALDHVLDQCSVDPTCRTAYPDLRTRWGAALQRSPRTRDLMEAVADELQSRGHAVQVPRLIDQIARGDLTKVDAILADNAGPSSMMRGERLSVWCRDDEPDTKPAPKHPELREWTTVAFDPSVCQAWPVTPRHPDHAPVVSDVPVLVLAGEYDPDTAPAWGRRVLRTLSRGLFLEIPGETHVAGDGPCPTSISMAFFRDPSRLPDVTCVARMAAPVFP